MDTKERLVAIVENINFDKEFLINLKNAQSISYRDFFDDCLSLADYFEKQKITEIAVSMENSVELVKLYFAMSFTNGRICVVDPQKGKKEICSILATRKEATVINNYDNFISEMTNLTATVDRDTAMIKKKVIDRIMARNFENDYLITFTSGTTGETKGVRNSLKNLYAASFALEDKLKLEEEGTYFHIMPMTYMAGILNSIFFPFILRKKILISQRFSVRTAISFWKTIVQYGVDVLWVSPTMLSMIEKTDRTNVGIDYCKKNNISFLVGTAALTENLRDLFENKYRVTLQASYGLSETLFISVETSSSRANSNDNNVGEILDGVDLIFNSDSELLINVPWMFLGYTNVNTDEYFKNGYYKSGDLAVLDNTLHITGRKKDLIIRGGMNISPVMIEKKLLKSGLIEECAVFGIKSSGEELVGCCYVTKEEKENLDATLSNLVLNELGGNYRIDEIYKIDELPRNINGKIDKEVLKKRYG